jgi:hypothetical protein
MEHIMQLRGKGKAELTLIGITEAGDTLYAMGYFLVDPKRKGELLPGAPAFLQIMRPKPYRRGCVFRAENGAKYKNVEPLELNKVHLYAVTLEQEIKLERVK